MPQRPLRCVYEISEAKEPPIYAAMMMIRDAARAWDGKDPIREFPS